MLTYFFFGEMGDNDDSTQTKKKPMTTEERLKLAAKLDKDLDDFIAGLEKKSYTEGWPEDRWQEVKPGFVLSFYFELLNLNMFNFFF